MTKKSEKGKPPRMPLKERPMQKEQRTSLKSERRLQIKIIRRTQGLTLKEIH